MSGVLSKVGDRLHGISNGLGALLDTLHQLVLHSYLCLSHLVLSIGKLLLRYLILQAQFGHTVVVHLGTGLQQVESHQLRIVADSIYHTHLTAKRCWLAKAIALLLRLLQQLRSVVDSYDIAAVAKQIVLALLVLLVSLALCIGPLVVVVDEFGVEHLPLVERHRQETIEGRVFECAAVLRAKHYLEKVLAVALLFDRAIDNFKYVLASQAECPSPVALALLKEFLGLAHVARLFPLLQLAALIGIEAANAQRFECVLCVEVNLARIILFQHLALKQFALAGNKADILGFVLGSLTQYLVEQYVTMLVEFAG